MKTLSAKLLSLNLETLRDLTPDEAVKVNGGIAQPTSSVFQPPHTGPVAKPTSTARPTGGTVVTAPVHHHRHHHR